jgi:hypothetical protein
MKDTAPELLRYAHTVILLFIIIFLVIHPLDASLLLKYTFRPLYIHVRKSHSIFNGWDILFGYLTVVCLSE